MSLRRACRFLVLGLWGFAGLLMAAPTGHGQDSIAEEVVTRGASVVVIPRQQVDPNAGFITLSTGGLILIRGQRFIVTQEPAPAAILTEPPPPIPGDAIQAPAEAIPNTVWVPGHWTPDADGFVWVPGRSIPVKSGHAFVPPRWVLVGSRHLFFSGFFVPHRVWVRSFFNTFHFSGDPTQRANATVRDRGPYWPIGVSARPGVSTTRSRGPYWPLGLGPPTALNQRGGTIVGLPSNNTRR